MYFLFRCMIRDWIDIDRIILGCIVISVFEFALFLVEHQTGRNMFAVFGGVPAITETREGRLRCQGPFAHSIMAGCFWASLAPIVTSRWWKSSKDKILSITGFFTSSMIVVFTASRTPLLGSLSMIVGAAIFPLRRHMRLVRWTVL
jgi:hypothetical protein